LFKKFLINNSAKLFIGFLSINGHKHGILPIICLSRENYNLMTSRCFSHTFSIPFFRNNFRAILIFVLQVACHIYNYSFITFQIKPSLNEMTYLIR
jgi:hypothetical protein